MPWVLHMAIIAAQPYRRPGYFVGTFRDVQRPITAGHPGRRYRQLLQVRASWGPGLGASVRQRADPRACSAAVSGWLPHCCPHLRRSRPGQRGHDAVTRSGWSTQRARTGGLRTSERPWALTRRLSALHRPWWFHCGPSPGMSFAGAVTFRAQTHPGPGTRYAQGRMLIPRGAGAVSAGTVTDIPSRPEHPAGVQHVQAGVQYRHPPESIIGARGLPADAEGKARQDEEL